MNEINFDSIPVFTLGGMSLDGLKKMLGELWDKLEEDVRSDIQWAAKTYEDDGYNPGAVRAISHLIAELSGGIEKDKITADQAQYLWEKAIDTLFEHDVHGPHLHILYKDYSKQNPMLMLGHILNVSEDFLLAKRGIRK
jgi:hypothetical protein